MDNDLRLPFRLSIFNILVKKDFLDCFLMDHLITGEVWYCNTVLSTVQMSVIQVPCIFNMSTCDLIVQWGSKNQTCPVFKWSKVDQFKNDLVFEW